MAERHLVLEGTQALEVIKALSSQQRLQILNLLSNQMLSVSEIAKELGQMLPTVAANVKKLVEAGLIHTHTQPGRHGSQKICSRLYDEITIKLPGMEVRPGKDSTEVSMPVGNYKEIEAEPTCGLASETGILGLLDDPRSFYDPQHVFAQLIWVGRGWVTYKFPNHLPHHTRLESLSLTMEISSEAPNYNEDWPSDITLWIEGVEIGTWRCPGDPGGRRGQLTPSWWLDRYSQFGYLKCWRVTHDGSYIDGVRLSDVTLADLNITVHKKVITVTLGNKPDAEFPRGFNLFGRKFGNYPQDLVLRLEYVPLPSPPATSPSTAVAGDAGQGGRDGQGGQGTIGVIEGGNHPVDHAAIQQGAGGIVDQDRPVGWAFEGREAILNRRRACRPACRQTPAVQARQSRMRFSLGLRGDDHDDIFRPGLEQGCDGPADDRLAPQVAPLLGPAGTAAGTGGDDDGGKGGEGRCHPGLLIAALVLDERG